MRRISSAEAFSQAMCTVQVWRELGMNQHDVLEGIGADTVMLRWVSWSDVIGEVARVVRLFYRRYGVPAFR
jgi:hypothetical protein